MRAGQAQRLKSALLLSILGLGCSVSTVWAQAAGVTIQQLGRGSIDYTEVIGGPTEVIMYAPTFEPGGSLGWHMHPGPVTLVVKTGELAVYTADGCRSVYPAGSGFVMPPGEVMDVRNETTGTVEVAATALVPVGQPLASSVTAPAAVCSR